MFFKTSILINRLPSNPPLSFKGKAGYIPSMYLQPYNNPGAGFYNLRKKHSSTLNLASSSGAEDSPTHSINPQLPSIMPGRLQKARSLDMLADTWTPTRLDQEASDDMRERSVSRASQFSSSSEFSSSSKEDDHSGSSSPDIDLSHHHRSSTSSESTRSVESMGNAKSAGPPRVPPRPRTEEIMIRCSTMTRKAALATKTRLQIQRPEPAHVR